MSPYRNVGLLLLNSSLIAFRTVSTTKGIRINFKCYRWSQDLKFWSKDLTIYIYYKGFQSGDWPTKPPSPQFTTTSDLFINLIRLIKSESSLNNRCVEVSMCLYCSQVTLFASSVGWRINCVSTECRKQITTRALAYFMPNHLIYLYILRVLAVLERTQTLYRLENLYCRLVRAYPRSTG